MLVYKLTDQNNMTANNTLWGENVTHSVDGDLIFCKNAIHFYTNPYLAVILNPSHAWIKNPKLWEAEAEIEIRDNELKYGTRELTTIKEIPIPSISLVQKVAFGILCARKVCQNIKWNKWADQWLTGINRTANAANAIGANTILADAAEYATYAAARYAADAARYAADAARYAADAARYAADAAVYAARYAADAARYAARYAADAAVYAAEGTNIALETILVLALSY